MQLNITITPLGRGLFEARLGPTVLCRSKTPFLSAARVLLEASHAPETLFTMTHEGSTVVAMRATLEAAAAQSVVDNDSNGPRFALYRAFNAETSSHPQRSTLKAHRAVPRQYASVLHQRPPMAPHPVSD